MHNRGGGGTANQQRVWPTAEPKSPAREMVRLPALLLCLASASAAPSPRANRTMTYWAGASDPVVHGRAHSCVASITAH